MMDMKPTNRRSGDKYMPCESAQYRHNVKRKVHAYHVFIQACHIAQGLGQYLSSAFPALVWASFGSWLRTIRPEIPPSKLVVTTALRQCYRNFSCAAQIAITWRNSSSKSRTKTRWGSFGGPAERETRATTPYGQNIHPEPISRSKPPPSTPRPADQPSAGSRSAR
jgi:hypothetical protein